MRRILLVLTAAMVMALMVVAMALPALAAPPQQGDYVGGGKEEFCTLDPETGGYTCNGGGGGHVVGEKGGCGSGGHRIDGKDETISVSGGAGCGGADLENESVGGRCVLNSEGTYDCVGTRQ